MRKLVTIAAIGLMLAVSACRNPDDREPEAAVADVSQR
jgi:hypothetical protein